MQSEKDKMIVERRQAMNNGDKYRGDTIWYMKRF